MSVSERKTREKEELRNKILIAAAEIVTESGYNNLKIRALAERIEYSPRTVYLYFPDKKALLEAVVEKGFQYTDEKMKNMDFSSSVSPEKILLVVIENHVKMAFSNPNYYRAVIALAMNKDFKPGNYQREVNIKVEQLIAIFLENISQKKSGTELIAMIVMNSLRAFTLNLINSDEKMNQSKIDKDLKIFTKLLFNGLKGY